MKIETKYNIGDRVWIVYEPIINNEFLHNEPSGEISVYEDEIDYMTIDNDGLTYGLKEGDISLQEKDVILYEETEKLAEKIKQMMEEIREREKYARN